MACQPLKETFWVSARQPDCISFSRTTGYIVRFPCPCGLIRKVSNSAQRLNSRTYHSASFCAIGRISASVTKDKAVLYCEIHTVVTGFTTLPQFVYSPPLKQGMEGPTTRDGCRHKDSSSRTWRLSKSLRTCRSPVVQGCKAYHLWKATWPRSMYLLCPGIEDQNKLLIDG